MDAIFAAFFVYENAIIKIWQVKKPIKKDSFF